MMKERGLDAKSWHQNIFHRGRNPFFLGHWFIFQNHWSDHFLGQKMLRKVIYNVSKGANFALCVEKALIRFWKMELTVRSCILWEPQKQQTPVQVQWAEDEPPGPKSSCKAKQAKMRFFFVSCHYCPASFPSPSFSIGNNIWDQSRPISNNRLHFTNSLHIAFLKSHSLSSPLSTLLCFTLPSRDF